MAMKKSGCVMPVASVVFSSVFCPVLVQIITNTYKGDDNARPSAVAVTGAWSRPKPTTWTPGEESVIARGAGSTPEAAWDDAVMNGLQTAILKQLEAQAFSGDSSRACDAIIQSNRALVTRCVDLDCTADTGFWRRKVAVYVDRRALLAKLPASKGTISTGDRDCKKIGGRRIELLRPVQVN